MRIALSQLIHPRLLALVPETERFYAARAAGRGPQNWNELQTLRMRARSDPRVSPTPTTRTVEADGRRVSVRIQVPPFGDPVGVLLNLHGGGFYMGTAQADDASNRRFVDALGIAVVSVDYRLAPEAPWPAAPDDCETAALWLAAQSQSTFGTNNLIIGGFSAGATLAMTTLLRLRERRAQAFRAGLLQFGTFDLSGTTPAGRLFADEYFLDAYLSSALDRTVPDISPAFADLAHLPPLLMIIGAEDILLPDNLAMAARLLAAGVDLDLDVYPASPHGFTGHPTPMARAALENIDQWLHRQLGL